MSKPIERHVYRDHGGYFRFRLDEDGDIVFDIPEEHNFFDKCITPSEAEDIIKALRYLVKRSKEGGGNHEGD
jgi:hypothetical protein